MTAFLGGIHPALALTWQKIGTTTGGSLTWNKVTFTQGTSPMIASLGGGSYKGTVIRSDGLVFACGYNKFGQLGDNSTVGRSTFIQVSGLSNIQVVAEGQDFSFALRSDGLVFASGSNSTGQQGARNPILLKKSIFQNDSLT